MKRSAQETRKLMIGKELGIVRRKKARLAAAAQKSTVPKWKELLSEKVPQKLYQGLELAFGKAFFLIFEKGTTVIEKSYNRQAMEKDFQVRDFAVDVKGTRKELRAVRKNAGTSDLVNLTVTTVEGIGLGALGIGMPDIVLFTGILLKGIYETALNYGYDYNQPQERYLILKMMEAAVSQGESSVNCFGEVDHLLEDGLPVHIDENGLKEQVEATARAFAMDMLVLKFIQGFPIAGILGGAGNPVCYRKVMKYVQLVYQERYLSGLLKKINAGCKN